MAIKVATGTYTGTGSAQSITGAGFTPKMVVVKKATGTYTGDFASGAFRFGSMPGTCRASDNGDNASDLITSIDSDGFSLGTDVQVNNSGDTFYYFCLGGDDSDIITGTYTGNGANDRSVTGVGFQPIAVFIHGRLNTTMFEKFEGVGSNDSFYLGSGAYFTNRINAFNSDGFVVDAQGETNQNAQTYDYIAIREVSGYSNAGVYTGNASDDRNITGVGFQPEVVIVKGNATSRGNLRTSSMATDNSLLFGPSGIQTNRIQSFISDGFQVGSDGDINNSGTTFAYLALKGLVVSGVPRLMMMGMGR